MKDIKLLFVFVLIALAGTANAAIYNAGATATNACTVANLGVSSGTSTAVTAQWQIINYNINYNNVSGATNPNPATYTIEDTISLVAPSKNGYNFNAWYSDSGLTTEITGWFESTGIKDIWASWTPIDYTITYYNVDGATNSNPATYNIESADITLSALSRTGATFEGWCTDSALENCSLNQTITTGSTGPKEFYAKWSVNTITLDYDENGGDAISNGSCSYGADIVLPAAPTRPGYTFVGWEIGE